MDRWRRHGRDRSRINPASPGGNPRPLVVQVGSFAVTGELRSYNGRARSAMAASGLTIVNDDDAANAIEVSGTNGGASAYIAVIPVDRAPRGIGQNPAAGARKIAIVIAASADGRSAETLRNRLRGALNG